jgi:hypothetical protein
MTRKALWLLPAGLAAVVASQWRDIARYLKIQQMSRGAPPAGDGGDPAERLFPPGWTVTSGTGRCRR